MMRDRMLIVAAALVALAQIVFLFSMIAGRASILRNGEVVVLRVEPVDPRDLLRGDYVILGYNISNIEMSLLAERPAEDDRQSDRTIYVRLAADGEGIWQPVAASLDTAPKEPRPEGQVDIRGTTLGGFWSDMVRVGVVYGIERFYVPEGQGRPIEENLQTRAFTMHVAVASDGSAQIKSFHDGERMLFEEPMF